MGSGKILVVDDEEKILDIVKSYLEANGFHAVCVKTGNEALSLWRREAASGAGRGAFDLVPLDLMLPDISGETVCRKIREVSGTPVIMLTAKADEESVVAGLNRGADDYVVKPFSPKELIARVEAVLRRRAPEEDARSQRDRSKGAVGRCGVPEGEMPRPPGTPGRPGLREAAPRGVAGPVLSVGGLTLDTESRAVRKNGRLIPITAKQFHVLALLLARPAKIWTRDEIIGEIERAGNGSDGFNGFDRAIDTHIKNLRRKLDDDPKSPRYIATVYGMGYRFGGMDSGPR
jgi:DNA-binding response OmpR family regulator